MKAIGERGLLFGMALSAVLGSCSVYDSTLLAQSGDTAGFAGSATGGAGGDGGPDGGSSGGDSSGGGSSGGSGANTAGDAPIGSAGIGGSPSTGGSAGGGESAGEAGQGCNMGDCCPNDPNKTEPGVCGCGIPDTDTDMDGTPDCKDQCPADPKKTAPQVCGCGVDEASCLGLKNSLLHRYSFAGSGTTVTDSKGSANGTVKGTGAALSGNGTLVLAGGVLPVANDPGQYVALPANCLKGLTDATFEAWVTWSPSTDSSTYQSTWQRVFDFGETATTSTGTYLMLTPRSSTTGKGSRVSFSGAGTGLAGETPVINGAQLNAGSFHFSVVVDHTGGLISLYVNGALSGATAFAASLSQINSSNCWLGRSQYANDPYFAGTFDEFRVYSGALSAAQVAFSDKAGANPAFL